MIARAFEDYLVKQEGAFLTPAANLAVLVDSHNVDHVILLLSQMTYSRIPVVTAEKKFVGTISLTDIMAYRMQHDLPEEEFMAMDIVHMTKTDGQTVGVDYTISEVLHKFRVLLRRGRLPASRRHPTARARLLESCSRPGDIYADF